MEAKPPTESSDAQGSSYGNDLERPARRVSGYEGVPATANKAHVRWMHICLSE